MEKRMKQGTHLLAAAVLAAMTAPALAATDLTVYTAFEPEQLGELKGAFERQHPDITIKWVRDSTGVVTARLLAEKAQPNRYSPQPGIHRKRFWTVISH